MSSSGSKPFDTLIVFLNFFLKKLILENICRLQKIVKIRETCHMQLAWEQEGISEVKIKI